MVVHVALCWAASMPPFWGNFADIVSAASRTNLDLMQAEKLRDKFNRMYLIIEQYRSWYWRGIAAFKHVQIRFIRFW